jgi:hypothetical protein
MLRVVLVRVEERRLTSAIFRPGTRIFMLTDGMSGNHAYFYG